MSRMHIQHRLLGLLARMRVPATRLLAAMLACILFLDSVGTVHAASTLFVNTESFETIDQGDGASNVELRFGQNSEAIQWNIVKNAFIISDDVEVQGILSGVTLYATKSFSGAGLTDCDTGATSKLLWDATTGRFSCGTDQGGGGGLGMSDADARYVNIAGDTMTGVLAVQNGNTHSATTTPLLNVRGTMSGRSLNISGTGAGAKPILFTDITNGRVGIGTSTPAAPLTISGSSPELRFVAGDYSRIVRSAVNNEVTWYNRTRLPSNPLVGVLFTGASSQYISSSTDGTALTSLSLSFWAKRSASATTKGMMQWANSLSSGGPFIYLRDASGTMTWYVNGGFNLAGGTLTDDEWTHIGLTWDGSTWKSYKNGVEVTTYSGGAGGFQANATSLYMGQGYDGYWSGAMDEIRVYNDDLSSSTMLGHYNTGLGTFGSSGEANILSGWHLDENTSIIGEDFTSGGTDMTLANGTTWTTGIVGGGANAESSIISMTDGNTAEEQGIITFGDTLSRTILNGFALIFQTSDAEKMRLTSTGLGINTSAPKTKLEVVGIMSGVTIYATQSFSGAGLTDCQNGTTSKLLWNATTGRFSCGTDQGGSGISQTDADFRFLKLSGGTLTGALTIQNGNTHIPTLSTMLNVRGTISGAMLRAGNMTVSGAVVYSSGNTLMQTAKGLSGQLLIAQGTNAPKWATPVGGMMWYFDGTQAVATSKGPQITMPFGLIVESISLSAKGAPTGAALIMDINKDGVSIFSTRPQIDADAVTGGGAAVFSTTVIPVNSVLTLDVDQIGSTFAGSGITVMLKGTRQY